VILDVPDDSDEKVRISHANSLKIYYVNEFMSLLKFCQSKHCRNESNDVNNMKILTHTDFVCGNVVNQKYRAD
jgi:hypothetical protein